MVEHTKQVNGKSNNFRRHFNSIEHWVQYIQYFSDELYFVHPNDSDSWNYTSIFHTFVPINKKSCKLVINGGSSMNVVFKSIVDRFAVKIELHPYPFNIVWVDKTFSPVKKWCLVTLKIRLYFENIYCEVLPMNVAHFLLGHP